MKVSQYAMAIGVGLQPICLTGMQLPPDGRNRGDSGYVGAEDYRKGRRRKGRSPALDGFCRSKVTVVRFVGSADDQKK